jgi:hypothetical protein
MAFVGPNTQFKQTASKFRRALLALGFNSIQVYNRLLKFKLRKHAYDVSVTALSTATTAGSQYTAPNGIILTIQDSAPVGATVIRMLSNTGSAPDASGTLTYVANSSGTLGTHQATIAYASVDGTKPADLGPLQTHE